MSAMSSSAALWLLAATAFAGPAAAEWGGEIRTVDGVKIVVNPETPANGERSFELRETWRVGGDGEDAFLFGIVSDLIRDDEGNVYLLDGQLAEVQIFSPEGEHLDTIGGQGEGPGEFQAGTDLFWAPGGQVGVVQIFPGKIVLIERSGDPGPTFTGDFSDGAGFHTSSRGFGVDGRILLSGTASFIDEGQQMQTAYLKAYDVTGAEVAHFHEESTRTGFGGWEFKEESFSDFQRRWAAAPDGRVAAALAFDEYRLHVWNADGDLLYVIDRPDYRAVVKSGAETERFQTMYDGFTRWNPGSTFRVHEEHVAVGQILFREDGRLWVQSSRNAWRPSEDCATAFDVYDREGRFVERVKLTGELNPVEDGLFFADNRAYIVTDLFSALISAFGQGDDEESEGLEPEPVSVIACELVTDDLARED